MTIPNQRVRLSNSIKLLKIVLLINLNILPDFSLKNK